MIYNRLLGALIALFIVVIAGIAGYMAIERWSSDCRPIGNCGALIPTH